MRALVVDMVGMVGLWVCGVVCLVRVVGLEGLECVFVACEEGEWIVGLGVRGRWGFGECWGKKLYYLVAPFKIADFRRE